MAKARVIRDNSGVSDVLGTVLLLGISVVIFTALSVAVYDQLQQNPPPANTEFRVDDIDDETWITVVWGESIPLEDAKLIFHLDDVRTIRPLSDPPISTNLAHLPGASVTEWDLGERLSLACPVADTCAYPGREVDNITVIDQRSNAVLFSSEPGVARGAVLNPLADLIVEVTSITDPARPLDPLYNGGTIEFLTTITNDGVLATPVGSSIKVSYYLDTNPAPFYTFTRTSFLGPGLSFTATNPALAIGTGSHLIRVAVTTEPEFLEAGLANNQVLDPFTVVPGLFDPNFPYEDGNADVLYNPYTATDLALSLADVQDGQHIAGGTRGLVIPPSVGPISTNTQAIQFQSTGRMTVGVSLTTGAHAVSLTSSNQLNLTGTVEIRSARQITLQSTQQMDLTNDRLDTSGYPLTITSTGGRILAPGATFGMAGVGTDPTTITLAANGGSLHLDGAQLRSTLDMLLDASGDADLDNAVFTTPQQVDLDISSPAFDVAAQGVQVEDIDDCVDVDPGSVTIVGVPLVGRVENSC